MSKSFNGRDALAELDRLTARVRQSLTEALAAADAAGARRTAIQKEQASAYAVLAQLRLGLMQGEGAPAAFGPWFAGWLHDISAVIPNAERIAVQAERALAGQRGQRVGQLRR